jgi:hypothetical protein
MLRGWGTTGKSSLKRRILEVTDLLRVNIFGIHRFEETGFGEYSKLVKCLQDSPQTTILSFVNYFF